MSYIFKKHYFNIFYQITIVSQLVKVTRQQLFCVIAIKIPSTIIRQNEILTAICKIITDGLFLQVFCYYIKKHYHPRPPQKNTENKKYTYYKKKGEIRIILAPHQSPLIYWIIYKKNTYDINTKFSFLLYFIHTLILFSQL